MNISNFKNLEIHKTRRFLLEISNNIRDILSYSSNIDDNIVRLWLKTIVRELFEQTSYTGQYAKPYVYVIFCRRSADYDLRGRRRRRLRFRVAVPRLGRLHRDRRGVRDADVRVRVMSVTPCPQNLFPTAAAGSIVVAAHLYMDILCFALFFFLTFLPFDFVFPVRFLAVVDTIYTTTRGVRFTSTPCQYNGRANRLVRRSRNGIEFFFRIINRYTI